MTRFQIIDTYTATGHQPRTIRRGVVSASDALNLAAERALSVVNRKCGKDDLMLAMAVDSVEWHGEHSRYFRVAYTTNPILEEVVASSPECDFMLGSVEA